MDTRPRVICGFPGVGKTTLFNKLKHQGILICDSDSSQFDKSQFPQNYIEHIKQQLAQGFWVLCSTHTVVREALREAGISYVIAAPAHPYLKDQYMQRYRDRGSPEGFINLMSAKFDEFMMDVWENDKYGIHYGLGEGEYLESMAKDIIDSDRRMKSRTVISPTNKNHQLRLGQPYFSTEHMKGFVAGLAWKDLIVLREFPGSPETTQVHMVHTDNLRIYVDMGIALELDSVVEKTMNPQVMKVTFKNKPTVSA
jgi:hypothetical protein